MNKTEQGLAGLEPIGWFVHSGSLESHICANGIWEECFEDSVFAVPFYTADQLRAALEAQERTIAELREQVSAQVADRTRIQADLNAEHELLFHERNKVAALTKQVEFANEIVKLGAELMPLEQLGKWAGVRAFMEMETSDYAEASRMADELEATK